MRFNKVYFCASSTKSTWHCSQTRLQCVIKYSVWRCRLCTCSTADHEVLHSALNVNTQLPALYTHLSHISRLLYTNTLLPEERHSEQACSLDTLTAQNDHDCFCSNKLKQMLTYEKASLGLQIQCSLKPPVISFSDQIHAERQKI